MQSDAPAVPVARAERGTSAESRRRFTRSSAIGIAISGAAFSWLVTGGTFNFLQSVPFSNFYDVQARSLLSGTWSMPANVLTIEGIKTDGRTDMYYGPVPALLRIPVLVFTHRFDGRLTEPSLLIGFLLALTFASMLSWRIRGLVRGSAPVGRLEAIATSSLIVVIGLGSVLFFLGATAQVYEEAEMWGATFALGAFYALIGFIQKPTPGGLVATGVLTTLVMLTRGSVGVGPLVGVGLVLSVYLLSLVAARVRTLQPAAEHLTRSFGVEVAGSSGRFAAGLSAAIGVPVALYVAVNEAKFGTLLSIPVNHQVFTLENAHRRAVLAANGGGLFGLKFIPTNLLQFVRPDALSVTRLFPWMFFPGKSLVLGNLLYDERDWTSSVPSSMPVLFLLALVGAFVVFRPAKDRSPALGGLATLRLPIVGAAAGTLGILTIAFIAQRYLADAVPLLFLGALAGWHFLAIRFNDSTKILRRLVTVLLSAIALFGLWTSFSLSLFYQRELGPVVTIPERAGMVSFQQQVNRELFGGQLPNVRFVSTLPTKASGLDLAVVGDCAGVYQYDGNDWEPVELGAGGGAIRLSVAFAPSDKGRRQPLLVTGVTPQDVVAVTWEGGDLYSFSYLFDGTLLKPSQRAWYTEAPVRIAAGRSQDVQVDLVTQLGMVYIAVDGSPAFSLLYPVAPPNIVRIGSAPVGLTTTAGFAGSIERLPVPTPICNTLEHDR